MKEKLKMLVVMLVLAALVFALPVLAEGQDGQEAVLLDLTKLAQAIISLAAGIVSLYLVPWLRSKLTNEQLSKAKSWVQIAVFAAEKLYGAGNGDQKLVYAEEILRKHGIRLDTATLKAMIDAQIKEMENTEPFCLADTKVEMIDNTKRAQRDMEFAPQHSGRKNHMKGQAIVIFRAFRNQSICLWKRIKGYVIILIKNRARCNEKK